MLAASPAAAAFTSPSAAAAAAAVTPVSSSRRFRVIGALPLRLRHLRIMRVAEPPERAAVDRELFGDVECRFGSDRDHPPQLIRLASRLNRRGVKGDRDRAAP